jgi:hypothetical protein
MRARVNVYNMGTNRGPGGLLGCIEDAANIGFSENVNDAGEGFFTLPYNHWAHSYLSPLNTHIQFQRQETPTDAWTTVGWQLLKDYDSGSSDTVYKTQDYLSLFDDVLTSLKTAFTGAKVSDILQSVASVGIHATYDSTIDPTSRLGFVSMGHIDSTAATATFMSDYQSRLALMKQAVGILQEGSSSRPIFSISRTSPFTFDFYANKGSEHPELDMVYGVALQDFRLRGDYDQIASEIKGIGQKLSGSTILYSTQTAIPRSSFGIIQRAVLFNLLPDQAALNKLTLSEAVAAAYVNKSLILVPRQRGGLAPYAGYALGDSIPVTIARGKTQLDRAYYTIWGLQWLAFANGTEQTRLIPEPENKGLAGIATAPKLPIPSPSPKPTPIPVKVVPPVTRGPVGPIKPPTAPPAGPTPPAPPVTFVPPVTLRPGTRTPGVK